MNLSPLYYAPGTDPYFMKPGSLEKALRLISWNPGLPFSLISETAGAGLCFVLYRAVVIRLFIYSDTYTCYCVASLSIVIPKSETGSGGGMARRLIWD